MKSVFFNDIADHGARSRSRFLNSRWHAKFLTRHEFISSCFQPIYIRRGWRKNVRLRAVQLNGIKY